MADVDEAMEAAEVNKSTIYYGIFKEQQQLLPSVDDDDNEADDDGAVNGFGDEKSKKKKLKTKASSSKKMKADPHAPSQTRIPLPEISESHKLERQNALKDIMKRVKLSPERLPTICQYTILNARGGVCCCELTEDSTTMAVGNGDSTLQIFSLTPDKLKSLKRAADLEELDRDAEDLMEQMLDENTAVNSITFAGHSGPVYGCSFSFDRQLLLSCSDDATVRLWSMYTWSNLTTYRLGGFPYWDVKFAPYGYYFATAGCDKLAMLWALDKQQPLRIFAGHDSDVNAIAFHPNSNYLATGSDDCTVRIWDVTSGNCVRYFRGHKEGVQSIQFSHDGRLLATGDADGHVILWSVGSGRMMIDLPCHEQQPVHALTFSRDDSVIASGGMDNKVKVQYLAPLLGGGAEIEERPSTVTPKQSLLNSMSLGDYCTKSTPVLHLHFTRKNLLLSVGAYEPLRQRNLPASFWHRNCVVRASRALANQTAASAGHHHHHHHPHASGNLNYYPDAYSSLLRSQPSASLWSPYQTQFGAGTSDVGGSGASSNAYGFADANRLNTHINDVHAAYNSFLSLGRPPAAPTGFVAPPRLTAAPQYSPIRNDWTLPSAMDQATRDFSQHHHMYQFSGLNAPSSTHHVVNPDV